MKQQGGQQEERPKWPGPVAGPGWPGQGQPQRRNPQAPPPYPPQPQTQAPPWPQPQQPQPQPRRTVQSSGEGYSMEGQSSEGYGSIETSRVEGISSMVSGSLSEEISRFRGASEQFRRRRPESSWHPAANEQPEAAAEPSPLVAALQSKDGLAQAVLMAEVLGKPRALRPYWKK